MTYVLLVSCIVFGLLIGSFLNVVVWRVPRGESVVHPASACPSCGMQIRPRDNVPVLSWLMLRGRCRGCAERISMRYPLVEVGTAGLFAIMAARFGLDPVLPAYLYLAAVGLALALIDLDLQRLPDALTLPSYPVFGGLLVVAAVVDGQGDALLRAAICGAIMFSAYFALWFVYPSGMGFGDVKLSGVCGLALGWVGYGALTSGFFAGFAFGAVVGLGLIVFRGGGRKTKVPFGPFMLLGTLVGVLWGQPLVEGYLTLTVG